MKKVFQTTFGGADAAPEDRGNCFQAAVASIFELPLEEGFDCRPYYEEEKEMVGLPMEMAPSFTAFREWLQARGFDCMFIQVDPDPPQSTSLLGYHLVEAKSTTLEDAHHILVSKDGEIVHDPNPNAEEVGKWYGVYLIIPVDPAALAPKITAEDFTTKW